MMSDDNPLLYRYQRARARTPLWRRVLARVLYPALVAFLPLWAAARSSHDVDGAYAVALFLHMAYFCGRPLFEAVATLATERQRGTLESLTVSGFTASRWVGTLVWLIVRPRLVELAWLGWIIAVLPGAGSLTGSLAILAYTATCIVFYAAAGLWLSARSHNVTSAQMKALLSLVFLFFFIVLVDAIVGERIFHFHKPTVCAYVSPIMVALCARYPRTLVESSWLASCLGQLALAGALLAWTRRRVGEAQPAEAPRPRTRLRLLANWAGHPAVYRSLLQLAGHRRGLWRLLAYPAILLSLRLLPWITDSRGDVWGGLMLALTAYMFYLTARAALAGSAAVAEEREMRTWESLLATRLSLSNVLCGLWAARVLPVVAEGAFWSFLWLSYSRDFGGMLSLPAIAGLVAFSLVWAAFVGTFAMWQSAIFSTSARALHSTVWVVLALLLGTILVDVGLGYRMDHAALLSPIFALESLLSSYDWGKGLVSLALYLLAIPACGMLCGLTLARQERRR